MPPQDAAPDGVGPCRGLAAILVARGPAGPVLVVADDDAIAAHAPAWAASFAAAGILHRVVVTGVDITAAATGLDARVIVAVGAAPARAAAKAAAAALGLPIVVAEATP